MKNSFQTHKNAWLGTKVCYVGFYYHNKSFNLNFWEIVVHCVSFYKLWSTLEKTVDEIVFCTIIRVEEFENSINELLK